MTDLAWWTGLASSPEVGRALWQQPVVAELTPDASGYGWGAVLNRTVPARGFFSLTEQQDHINVQELMALDKALDCFPMVTGPGVLRLRLDSTVSVAVMNNMTTRSPALMAVLTSVSNKLSARGLRAEASWLSSVANAHADKLSRDKDSSDWTLNAGVFRQLDAAWGPLTVDRFATAENSRLPRFNSLVASAGTKGINGWSQPWSGENNYVCPLLSQAGLVLPKTQREGANVVALLPEWPAMPWRRPILLAAHEAVYLPSTAQLFTRGRWAAPARQPRWRTVAFCLRDGGKPPIAWRGGMPPTPTSWAPSALRAPALPRQSTS